MSEENSASNVRMKTGRWKKDASGRYHYRGVCPFNRAVCGLLIRGDRPS